MNQFFVPSKLIDWEAKGIKDPVGGVSLARMHFERPAQEKEYRSEYDPSDPFLASEISFSLLVSLKVPETGCVDFFLGCSIDAEESGMNHSILRSRIFENL